MFLRRVLSANPDLIRVGAELHQAGLIPPNCFVLDVDAIERNARMLAREAAALGLSLYFMSKQIGHNPWAVAAIRRGGIDKAVAVDMRSAVILAGQRVPIGNIGHLSQIPRAQMTQAVSLKPDVITVYNETKAQQLSGAAAAAGRQVDVLLRLWPEGDNVFVGQEGGLRLETLLPIAKRIGTLPGLRVVGLTAFPCVAYAGEERRYRPTPNLQALVEGAQILREQLGMRLEQINAPGASCLDVLALVREAGANFAEPGHALTGTNPHHSEGFGEEAPAVIYVSEVAHVDDGTARVFGGGLYRRGGLVHALVGSHGDILDRPLRIARSPGPSYIDYYFGVDASDGPEVRVGDTVVCAFRSQVFIAYACVAAITGLAAGRPRLEGLSDVTGRPYLDWTPA